jgi:ACR3 family arsenite efflux pump ArsB
MTATMATACLLVVLVEVVVLLVLVLVAGHAADRWYYC